MTATAVKPSEIRNGRCVDCGRYAGTAHDHGPVPPPAHPIFDAVVVELGNPMARAT